MWNVEMKCNEHYNCLQNVICSMARFYHTSYSMMMLELWGFKYDKQGKGSIGDKLSLPWFGEFARRNYFLETFHGMNFHVISVKQDVCNEIHAKLVESPVGCYLDSYYCEWTSYYKVQHREHIVLIIEEKEDSFIAIDDTCQQGETLNIEKSYIEEHCIHYLVFDKTQPNLTIDYKKQMRALVKHIDEAKMFEQYKDFITDMVENLDLSKELVDQNNPVTARLFMLMKNIADDRINFTEGLEYIQQYIPFNVAKVNEDLLQISHLYEKIRAYIIRCSYLKRKPDVDIIKKEFTTILNLELNVYTELKNI